ncbi:HPP family protein [Formosa agariphila KMM 3901]|uniref:HPP family protein n=1 Tax=Formosa agariphila (strain DSM 15362 / KCTC 12365 / LMG 23005 / KMM 3901 / M-2Alg 35-1) TaxID=1347342 RepID=T2KIM6_FORAG|nr:HPP family protein [Formosa agariphila]CDF77809.1 HPP family protein [Formosa agariphila KMM 3901]
MNKKLNQRKTYRKAKLMVVKQTIIDPIDHLWSFIGAFTGIALIGSLQTLTLTSLDNTFLIGSFGASAVLIYGETSSPLAQPRNLVGGHLFSAIIGVCIAKLIPNPDLSWLACALAVSIAIVAMQITKTMHPPGGATALIAVIGSTQIKNLGFLYVINPVFVGVLILLVTAYFTNRFARHRQYPFKSNLK